MFFLKKRYDVGFLEKSKQKFGNESGFGMVQSFFE